MIWISLNSFIQTNKNQNPCRLTFQKVINIIKVSAFMIISILKQFLCPGHWNPVFFRLSGFSKSTYLESTCYGEFPDAKIFPDKICPGSGLAIFLNCSNMSTQNNQKLRFLCLKLFPDAGIQIFCQNSSFSKSAYLEPTCYEEFTQIKISPEQILSRIRFCPEQSFLNLFLNLS